MKHGSVLVVCLLLVTAPMLVTAQEDENETEEEEYLERANGSSEREVEVSHGSRHVRIESRYASESGGVEQEDEFELAFTTYSGSAATIELGTASEIETNTSESERESWFGVSFQSLIEFVDENGNGVYDEGEGISTYRLRGFQPIRYTASGGVHEIEATTTDNVFTVRLHAVGDVTDIKGEQVNPSEVKIDLEIHDFQFSQENSTLALKTNIDAETETEEELEEEERSTETVIESGNTFFSWKKQATVDGTSTTVATTSLTDDGDEKTMYFNYAQGSSIVHDPKIGVKTGVHRTGGGIFAAIQDFFNWLFGLFQ